MIYIELTQFEINVHRAIQPSLQKLPMAIVRDKKILHCDILAIQHGVRVGMSVEHARTKAKNFCAKNERPKLYAEFSKEFYTLLSNFSTTIEPVSQSSAFVDASGLLGGESYAAQLINSALTKELELPCAIGIGSSKTIAQCAANLASPEGIINVEKKDEKHFMENFPVSFFPGFEHRRSLILAKNGIQTIHEFAAMHQQDVIGLLGNRGVELQNFAKGIDDRKLEMPPLQSSITHSVPLSRPSRRHPYLLTMLHFLITQVEKEANRNHCFPRAIIVFGLTGNERVQKQVANTSQDSHIIREKAEACLTALIQKSESPFERIGVQFNQLVPCKQSPYFFSALRTFTQTQRMPSEVFHGASRVLV